MQFYGYYTDIAKWLKSKQRDFITVADHIIIEFTAIYRSNILQPKDLIITITDRPKYCNLQI